MKKNKEKKAFDYSALLYSTVALGFILRIIFLTEINNSPFNKILFSDAFIYFEHANNMLKNNSLFGSEVFFMSPFYSYFLTLAIALFNDAILFTRLLQIIISTGTIYLVFLIGKNLHSEKTGLFAAVITAIYPLFIFYSSSLLLETLQVFIVTILVYLIIKDQNQPDGKHWFWVGIVLGLAAILRANILLFFPVLIVWLFIRFRKNNYSLNSFYKVIFFFTIGAAIPVVPITLQNYLAEKDFVLITSNGGINFYLGNHAAATGIYKTPENYDLFFDLSGKNFAERKLNKTLTSSEASSYWLSRGLDFAVSQPWSAAKLTAKKVLLFLGEDENPQSAIMDMDFFRKNYSTLLKFPLPGFYVVMILSIFGIFLHRERNHNYKIMVLLLITYIISIVLFFVVGRFRLAVTPVIIIFSAIGMNEIWLIIKEKNFKKLTVPLLVVFVLIALNFTLTPKFNFSEYDAYVSLGNSYFEKKQYDLALNNYKRSLELKEDPGTYVMIANVYSAQKDVNNAMRTYKRAVEINPDYLLAYFNVGILYTQLGSFDEAIKAFNKTIELDSKFKEAYKNLAVIYYMVEEYKLSLYNFEKVLELTKNIDEKTTVTQDIQAIKQKLNMTK